MHDILEGTESAGERDNNPLVLPVSVTLSILAVMVAAATLLGHRAHTEELLLQTRATDQWAYYQAKNIRQHETQSHAKMLGVLAAKDAARADVLRDEFSKEASRYDDDKDEITAKAKEFEAEKDVVSRRADRFDASEGLLEIALVICSITLLTKRRIFWFAGMSIGVVGVAIACSGLLLHSSLRGRASVMRTRSFHRAKLNREPVAVPPAAAPAPPSFAPCARAIPDAAHPPTPASYPRRSAYRQAPKCIAPPR